MSERARAQLEEFAAAVNGSERPVFVHEMGSAGARWHFGDCFPNMDNCAIPTGEDLDQSTH